VPTRLLRGVDPGVDALLPDGGGRDLELESALSELRLVKDAWEVAEISGAVDATVRCFEDVVRALPALAGTSRGERWVEGVFGLRARIEGNGLGYDTIAAAGSHACTLHWIRNDGEVRSGELLLLDAGVEADSLHTADVTRTLPVDGRFTPVQRQVYDLVYAAQEAGIAAVRPGARFRDFHLAAMEVIARGLESWGLLPVSAAESMRPESGLHRRYTLCSSGHMLGLDVHDCAQARAETYLDGVLEVGHVLTVEPGLYFQADDLTLPPELRGIGVRIEDDVVVTEDGCRVLSSGLPRQADEVEAWMARLWAQRP
jgi:Xaa-Pro aminopeptidase